MPYKKTCPTLSFQKCGCVAYHMPKSESMPICPISKLACIADETERIESNAFNTLGSEGMCKCLPSCTDIEYKHFITSSKIVFADDLQVTEEQKNKMPELKNDEFVRDNIVTLHIYHKSLHFLTRNRGVVS